MLANDPNFTSIIAIIKSLYGVERSEKVEKEVEELIDNILNGYLDEERETQAAEFRQPRKLKSL